MRASLYHGPISPDLPCSTYILKTAGIKFTQTWRSVNWEILEVWYLRVRAS